VSLFHAWKLIFIYVNRLKQEFKIGDLVRVNDLYGIFGDDSEYLIIGIADQGNDYCLYTIVSTRDLKNGVIKEYEASDELLAHIIK